MKTHTIIRKFSFFLIFRVFYKFPLLNALLQDYDVRLKNPNQMASK